MHPRHSCPTGKNKPTSLDLRSSFVATRQSANKFAFALAAPKLARTQEKPYIALSGEGRLRLGIAQASLALHSACTALDAGDPRVEYKVLLSLLYRRAPERERE